MSLTRSLLAGLVLALLTLVSPLRAEDDDPVVRDKKLSEWIALMANGKTVEQRRAGLLAVRYIGPRKSRKVIPSLIAAARENSEVKIRAGAAQALGYFASKARDDDEMPFEKIRDCLAAALRTDKSAPVREASAKALGDLKGNARGAVGVLSAALKDSQPRTRTAAAEALRKLGKAAFEAVDELQASLKDAKQERLTRVHCAAALGRIGAPDASPAAPTLRTVLGDAKTDGEIRRASAWALGELGKDAAEAVPTLASVLTAKDAGATLRRDCAEALDKMGADARPALSALRTALKDDDSFVRSLSLHAISRMGRELGDDRKTTVVGVLRCMDDNVLEVRVSAIEALGNLGSEGLGDQINAVKLRLTAAKRDVQKAVSDAAEVALKKLQGTP